MDSGRTTRKPGVPAGTTISDSALRIGLPRPSVRATTVVKVARPPREVNHLRPCTVHIPCASCAWVRSRLASDPLTPGSVMP